MVGHRLVAVPRLVDLVLRCTGDLQFEISSLKFSIFNPFKPFAWRRSLQRGSWRRTGSGSRSRPPRCCPASWTTPSGSCPRSPSAASCCSPPPRSTCSSSPPARASPPPPGCPAVGPKHQACPHPLGRTSQGHLQALRRDHEVEESDLHRDFRRKLRVPEEKN